jgi:hypothetical protein
VAVDYLEETRFFGRFHLTGPILGWTAWVVADVADPGNRTAVLEQVRAAVAREIESRQIISYYRHHPAPRKRLFQATGMEWTMAGDWPIFAASTASG